MQRLWGPVLLGLFFVWAPLQQAHAYTAEQGELWVRPVLGASVNALRLDVATRATPPAGLLVGVDLDYALTREVAITGAFRPVISPGFIDGALMVGAKLRYVELQAPFIPYVSAGATTAIGLPLGYGEPHWSLGGRFAVGVDYFVTRHIAIGVESGGEASWLFTPLESPELTADALVGVTWRF